MPVAKSYKVLVKKTAEKFDEAKIQFFQFLAEQSLDTLVSDRDKLFVTLVGKLSQGTHPDVSLSTTNTFVPADLEQTAYWLSDGYKGRKVDGRKFDQKSREYYDTKRYSFGRDTELTSLGLSDGSMESQLDSNLTALFGRETKTNPQLTVLFEYAVGTLSQKPDDKFEFKKGVGRELADRLKEHYKVETETKSYEIEGPL